MSDVSGDGNRTKLPKITIIVANKEKVRTNYQNANIINDSDGSAPAVFNRHLEIETDYFLCLGTYEELINDPLEEWVAHIEGKPDVGGVYCDTESMIGDYAYAQHYPIWQPALLNGNMLINAPLLFRPTEIRYNEQLEGLYHFQFLLELGSSRLLRHLPKTCVCYWQQPRNINEELEVIKKCLTQ